jgi:hypothetical protein
MKSKVLIRALSGALVMVLGMALVGCGGGGGGATPAPGASVTLSGTAVAGKFRSADVKVYDATVYTELAPGTPIATGTTDNDGEYTVSLPAGFTKPVVIVVSAKADGTSSVLDEVFGVVLNVTNLTMRSVVPSEAYSGTTLTGYVTPYTNLMYEIVQNKVGNAADVNAAINQARSVVNQLNGNVDPLNTNPVTDPAMVVRLAAVSNIAKGLDANDPDDCNNPAKSPAEKITCTIGTLGKAVTPIGATDNTSLAKPLELDGDVVKALKNATDTLDTQVVADNTGLAKSDCDAEKTETSNQLTTVQSQPTLTAPASAVATGIQQAKAFFANLRTGILPYANNNQDGFLDTEGRNLNAEFDALNAAAAGGTFMVGEIAGWAEELHDGTMPSDCSGTFANAICTQLWQGVVRQAIISGSGTAWSMNGGSLTGTITFNAAGTEMTMNGFVPAETVGAEKANVTTLKVSRTAIAGQADMFRYTLTGSMTDLKNCTVAGCTPVVKLEMGAGSFINVHDPATGNSDITKSVANFTGTFITANYRFIGELGVSSVQAETSTIGFPPFDFIDERVEGGTASFTGTINGTGLTGVDADANNNFNLLVGKLETSVSGAGYNPFALDSATNFQTGSMTFTGTVFKSAADPGLKLVVTMTLTGWDKGALTVAYNDFNKGISVTGTAPWDDHSTVTQFITLSDANGISVKIGDRSAGGLGTKQVLKGATVLGTINDNRVTYEDGTFESLL